MPRGQTSIVPGYAPLAALLQALSLCTLVFFFCAPLPAESTPPARPNILLIITDDQRFDTMAAMPATHKRIFDRGVSFAKAFVTTPSCAPSRASILTGQLASSHGVHGNRYELKHRTVAEDLHEAGYFTGMLGKYLNSWDGSPRSEFDYWSVFPFGSSTYLSPRMNKNGTLARRRGYITEILADDAIEFLTLSRSKQQPFFLLFAPNAPHAPATPSRKDTQAFSDLPPHSPPSFMEADMQDKPQWLKKRKTRPERWAMAIQRFRLRQLRSLAAVDRAIEKIFSFMEKEAMLDNTVVIFMSDNGIFWGEHHLSGKDAPYEEAIRIPFAVLAPSIATTPRADTTHLVANIDIAPTLYELAKLPLPQAAAGMSLLPLLSSPPPQNWRQDLPLEGFSRPKGRLPFVAIRTSSQMLARYRGGDEEYYDLARDPFQLENQISSPQASHHVAALRAKIDLRALPQEKGPQDFPTKKKLKRLRTPAPDRAGKLARREVTRKAESANGSQHHRRRNRAVPDSGPQ